MSIGRIKSMLENCFQKETHFPPTDLYNEGWMLRLFLDWFENHQTKKQTGDRQVILVPKRKEGLWEKYGQLLKNL